MTTELYVLLRALAWKHYTFSTLCINMFNIVTIQGCDLDVILSGEWIYCSIINTTLNYK
jgi:hypothetical protein